MSIPVRREMIVDRKHANTQSVQGCPLTMPSCSHTGAYFQGKVYIREHHKNPNWTYYRDRSYFWGNTVN